MTARILKFTISPEATCVITLPQSARVLHVAEQNTLIRFWMEVPQLKDARLVRRTFQLIATGGDVTADMHYRGTCLCDGGLLVWHLYEKRSWQQPSQDAEIEAAVI